MDSRYVEKLAFKRDGRSRTTPSNTPKIGCHKRERERQRETERETERDSADELIFRRSSKHTQGGAAKGSTPERGHDSQAYPQTSSEWGSNVSYASSTWNGPTSTPPTGQHILPGPKSFDGGDSNYLTSPWCTGGGFVSAFSASPTPIAAFFNQIEQQDSELGNLQQEPESNWSDEEDNNTAPPPSWNKVVHPSNHPAPHTHPRRTRAASPIKALHHRNDPIQTLPIPNNPPVCPTQSARSLPNSRSVHVCGLQGLHPSAYVSRVARSDRSRSPALTD
eukprot:1053177-Prorocentrum_minimum.AAC.3